MTTLMEISDTASRATASLQGDRKPPGRPQASRATASLQGDRKPPGRPQGIAPTIHGLSKLIRCIVGGDHSRSPVQANAVTLHSFCHSPTQSKCLRPYEFSGRMESPTSKQFTY